MKKAFWKKPAALILTVAMMLSLMPASTLTAWAAPEDLKTITLDEANNQYLYIFDSGYLLTKSAVTSPTTSSIGFQPYSDSYELSSSPAATTVAAFVKVMGNYTSGGGARTINLKDLHIDVKSGNENCAFELKVGADVNLHLKGNNTLQSGINRAGLQVPSGASISIGVANLQSNDFGSLDARSDGNGAGIGGGPLDVGGSITISGGTVNAYSRYNGTGAGCGAGIGGGRYRDGGNITITGGIVNAYSSHTISGYGAGIGGGQEGAGGNINISGGNVQAYSSYSGAGRGAGIGGGREGAGGNINISGGNVQAYSSYLGTGTGAGIGGGDGGTGGNITITGGSILPKATSLGAISINNNPTNGAVNVYLATITIGKLTGSSIISVAGIGSYGLKDVKTDDEGKVYFWLPTNQAITALKVGGQTYVGAITSVNTNTASAIFKIPTSTAVSKPTGTAETDSITVTNPIATTGQSIEYALTTHANINLCVTEWQDSITFSGLNSDTSYYIWARIKESGSYGHGPEAISDAIKTLSTASSGNTGSSSSSTSTQPKTDEEEQKPIELFTDIKDHWAYNDILYVVENEIMNGFSSTRFAPDETMSRAMMATVLYRMEKEPSVSGMATSFDDVVKNQWYTNAVVWGANTDIVKGYSDAIFGVNDNITREQMVTILYRYAMLKGMDVSGGEDTNILSYGDAFSISEYAIPAMQWAAFEGLIKGRTDGTIDPQGTATRAEIAAVLHRFNSISK